MKYAKNQKTSDKKYRHQMPSLIAQVCPGGSCYDGRKTVNVNAGRFTGPFIPGSLAITQDRSGVLWQITRNRRNLNSAIADNRTI
jgi:hypothetical protein